jgi:hypothetical protein
MFRIRFAGAALAALALLALPTTSRADWPRDPGTGGLPLCNLSFSQSLPISVPDGSGGTIVVWSDGRPGGTNDIYAQHVSAAGVPLWTANGTAVCTASGNQSPAKAISDGAGGIIVCWFDNRSGANDIYAQRINGNGLSLWTSQGFAVCTATGSQDQVAMASDGAGGAILSWRDQRGATPDLYAQRVTGAGAASWAANGIVICNAADTQQLPSMCEDIFGGAYITWTDSRNLAANSTDVYLQRVNSSGSIYFAANGMNLTNIAQEQSASVVAPDGLGGVFIAWNDFRSGGHYDIYAEHVLMGASSPLYVTGLPVCTAAGDQTTPIMIADGSGGVFLTWTDYRAEMFYSDAYVARVTTSGMLPWTANGVALGTATLSQVVTGLVADGAGGVVAVWSDQRNTNMYDYDIYVQRLNSAGSTTWTSGGVAVIAAVGNQISTNLCAQPDDSYTLAWTDSRNVGHTDIYAQRVDRYGKLGTPEPAVTKVKDVPNDQGGSVKVSWNASYLDADPTYGIFEYRVFRSVPGSIAGLASKRATTIDSDVAAETGALLVTPNSTTATAWEYVGTQAAEAIDSYSRVVATTSDSIGGSNPRTYFMVEARAGTAISSQRWFSAPDSGYSVDNLGPAAPTPLTGQYVAGTTRLHWNPNTEADLDVYRVYRGTSVAFTPSLANLVEAVADTGYADAAGSAFVYKVTAVDIHGNESPVATLIPSGTLGVSDGVAGAALEFAAPQPNPARGTTTLRFSLTQRGPVKLALFDAAGRRVTTIADGVMDAGMHTATLQLRDGAGRELPAGLYLARFEAEGRTITRRVVAVK